MSDGEDVVIVDDSGTEHVFPAGFDPVKAGAIVRASTTHSTPADLQPTNTAVSIAGPLLRGAANLAERVATSPTLPRTAATIGRITGAIAPAGGELATGNLPAAIAMLGNAGKTAWAGGKSGWFTGKLLQRAAAPVATALSSPAATAVSDVLNTRAIAQAEGDVDAKGRAFFDNGTAGHYPMEKPVAAAVLERLRALFGGAPDTSDLVASH